MAVGFVVNMMPLSRYFIKRLKRQNRPPGPFLYYFTTRNAGRPPRGGCGGHRQDECHHRDLACRHQ